MDANSKVVEETYAAFSRGDIPFILERLSADVQFEHSDSAEIPYGGSYRGKDEVGRFFANVGGAVDVKSFEPKSYLSSGDEVMTTGVWSGVARKTGKSFKSQWAMRFTVKNSQITFC